MRVILAHYRDSALERARQLDPELLALALTVPPADWKDEMLTRMARNRWYRPDKPPQAAPRVMLRVGAFVGYGGRFAEPPLVGSIDGELLLHSAGQRFSLHADVYGAKVQPHSDGKLAPAHELPPGWRIEGSVLLSPDKRFPFVEQGAITSSAVTIDTLVLTHAWCAWGDCGGVVVRAIAPGGPRNCTAAISGGADAGTRPTFGTVRDHGA